MKKAIFATVILLAILGASLYNIHYLERFTGQLLDLSASAQAHSEAGDYAQAVADIRDAVRMWTEQEGYTHILIRHTEIDTTTDAFFDLLSDLYAGDGESARAGFGKLNTHLSGLADMERIRFGSIF